MKLLHCLKCGDTFSLRAETLKICHCGETRGKYRLDHKSIVFRGPAVVIGFVNKSYNDAIQNQPKTGVGKDFQAFVFPRDHTEIKKVGSEEANARVQSAVL